MSPIEMVATLLGVTNVFLIVRRSVWNYPYGLIMVTLYAYIFYDAKLYSDVLLQIFFFGIQVYGWCNWLQGRQHDGLVRIETMLPCSRAAALSWATTITFGLGWFMAARTDAAFPYWDAAILGMSIVAQTLLSRRKIENWFLWIVADIVAISVYWAKDLHLTAGLYALFLCMAIWGFVSWLHALGVGQANNKSAVADKAAA
jgi:nicotinamide mononucleotide transporter